MATKITKAELKEMIREALREELARVKQLKESAIETADPYVVLNRDDDNFRIFCVTNDIAEAVKVYDKTQRKFGFRADIEAGDIGDGRFTLYDDGNILDLVQFFDINTTQFSRLKSLVGKVLTGPDNAFITLLYKGDNYDVKDVGLVKLDMAGVLSSDGKVKSDISLEFEILYKDHSYNSNEVCDVLTYASSAEVAEEAFWESILDEENYDDGEPVDQDDIEILSITPTGKFS